MTYTIPSLLDRAALEFGDQPYLSDKSGGDKGVGGWQALSYTQTRQKARELACALMDLGLEKGDTAVIMAEGRSAWVVSELALLHAGGVCVPISLKLLPEEIPFRVNHSEAKAIFFSSLTWEKVASARAQFERPLLSILFDDDDELLATIAAKTGLVVGATLFSYAQLCVEGAAKFNAAGLQARLDALGPDDEATICYTSGTTGNPKGIVLTHGNYWANCEASVELFQMPYGLRTLVVLPIDHSFAHTVALYGAFFRAMHLFFLDSSGGGLVRNIPSNLLEVKPQFLLTVPSLTGNFMKKILAGIHEKGGLIEGLFLAALKGPGLARWLAGLLIFPKVRSIFGGELQFMVGGGALLDIKQQEFFAALGVPVFQGYGLTEATPIISANTRHKHRFGTSGLVLGNLELTIRDENFALLPPGQKGEIVIKGPSVMKGYLKNPGATEAVLKEGWLRTGDLGYMSGDFLMVVGREKALLIAQDGEKYSPEEIEEAITNTSGLVDQVMLSCDHKNYTVALVVLDQSTLKELAKAHPTPEALLEEVARSLSRFKADPAFAGRFPSQWCPSAFALLTEPFTEQNKMINSTLKMVRFRIAETHGDLLESLYTADGRRADSPHNRQALTVLLG